jgi:excisionase family DNA binding protein
MKSTYTKGTTFNALLGSGLPKLPGQGADSFPAFSPEKPVIEKLYTVPEVAQYLRIGPRPVYAAIQEGRLVSSWVGRSHLVSESNLAAYVKVQERATSWHGKKVMPEAK